MLDAAKTFLFSGENAFYVDFIITAITIIVCGIIANKIDNKIIKTALVLIIIFMLARMGLKIFGIEIGDVFEHIAQEWIAEKTGVMPEYDYSL